MIVDFRKRRYGIHGYNPLGKSFLCDRISLEKPPQEHPLSLPPNTVKHVDAGDMQLVLLQNNRIQFAGKPHYTSFRDAPINGFILTRSYHQFPTVYDISISPCAKELWVNVGLYILKFTLPYFNYIGSKINRPLSPNGDAKYDRAIMKICDYLANPSHGKIKKQYFAQVLQHLEQGHAIAAFEIATRALSDKQFIKATFYSNAKSLMNELLTCLPLPFQNFPKMQTVKSEEFLLFKQLVDDIIKLSKDGQDFIPCIQAWFNVFIQRQEWIMNNHLGKKYGGFDAATYRDLYAILSQEIEPATKSLLKTILEQFLAQKNYDITSSCLDSLVIFTNRVADKDDYATMLAGHIENSIITSIN